MLSEIFTHRAIQTIGNILFFLLILVLMVDPGNAILHLKDKIFVCFVGYNILFLKPDIRYLAFILPIYLVIAICFVLSTIQQVPIDLTYRSPPTKDVDDISPISVDEKFKNDTLFYNPPLQCLKISYTLHYYYVFNNINTLYSYSICSRIREFIVFIFKGTQRNGNAYSKKLVGGEYFWNVLSFSSDISPIILYKHILFIF